MPATRPQKPTYTKLAPQSKKSIPFCLGLFLFLAAFLAACSRNPGKDLASGDKSFAAGKYDEAVIHYRNAAQDNPGSAIVHYRLAQSYIRLKSFQQAFWELQKTIDMNPRDFEAQAQLASLLIGSKKYDDARTVAMKMLAIDPRNAAAHGILGDRLALTGDPEGAVREYRASISLDPHRVSTYLALGALYRSRGQFSDAEAAFREATVSDPQSEQARLILAGFYISQKDLVRATAELVVAAKLAPRDVQPLLMLVDAYTAQGNQADGEKIGVQLKIVSPDDPNAYHALATFYKSTKQNDKAISELEALKASKPRDTWVKASLAEILLDRNRVQEASALIDTLLSSDGGDSRALTLRGRALLSQHKVAEAQTALEKAVQIAGGNAAAWYYLGIARQLSGLPDMARSSFAKARELSPAAISPRLALAEIDANHGDYGESERLASGTPGLPQADVVAARAELAKGNLGKAEAMVQSQLALDPASLPALEILLKVQARQGRLPEAIRRLSDLVSQYPQNPGIDLLLARAYLETKDLSKAEVSARRALSLDPQLQDVHAVLAAIHSGQGQNSHAAAEWKAEIDASPHNDANYLALAGVYQAEGKWQDAISTLERARVSAGSAYVDNNLAWLYLEHGGDTTVALSLAREARRLMPDSPLTAGTLGWALYRSGSYETAITQLSFATEKLPKKAENEYHLGMAFFAAHRFQLAAVSLTRALKIDPDFAEAESAKQALDKIARTRK
jgi:tetratricopeptide (TPR) repeat protein